MKILLLAATGLEIREFLPLSGRDKDKGGNLITPAKGYPRTDVLITGPGIPATILHTIRLLDMQKFDLVINAGIAGSFSHRLPVGSCVNVTEDRFPEMGGDYLKGFEPMYTMEMARDYLPVFMDEGSIMKAPGEFDCTALSQLPPVKGITVNMMTDREDRINALMERTGADVETMEGAAVFWCCHHTGTPCRQVRSISNLIRPGEEGKWKVKLAVDRLQQTLKEILDELF